MVYSTECNDIPIALLIILLHLSNMQPDYSTKLFTDKRCHYNLLVLALAIDTFLL